MSRNAKVLIVEDDPVFLRSIQAAIAPLSDQVFVACDGKSAIKVGFVERPDMLLLDLALPGCSGYEVCSELREALPELRILIISGDDSEEAMVRALDSGADDFVVKPFRLRELQARVRAGLRHLGDSESIACSDFVFLRAERVVTKWGQTVELTNQEFEALNLLIERKGKVVSRDFMHEETARQGTLPGSRTIDRCIAKLRAKIGSHHIKTVQGIGYRFVD